MKGSSDASRERSAVLTGVRRWVRQARGGRSDPLRIALYSGLFVKFDAISTSLRHKVELLDRLRAEGCPIELTIFAQGCDYPRPDVVVLADPDALRRDPRFLSADVHCLEFGMYYELLEAIATLAPGTPILAVDHNTTPPDLVDSEDARDRCRRAIEWRGTLKSFSHVATDGEFTRDELLGQGFPPGMLSVLHLPPTIPDGGAREPRRPGEGRPVDLLYVGRFVRAKGVTDLITAVEPMLERGDARLTLVGDTTYSDPGPLAAVETAVSRFGGDGSVRLCTGISDEEMARRYLAADALVLPSYHEGYCVPVVEALTAGCYPITYDSGNLPHVAGGLGTLVATGNVPGLRDAVADLGARVRTAAREGSELFFPTREGDLTEPEWRTAVRFHLRTYTRQAYEAQFRALLRQLARQTRSGAPTGL